MKKSSILMLTPDEYRQSNGTASDTWAFVEQDLSEAINSGTLPSKSSANDAETGIRVTKEYAQALLGKAYLFQGKNSEAASMLDNVINSNKYALFAGEYDAQFHAAANNNRESLFELQKRNDAEQLWNTFDFIYIMQGWRTSVLSYGMPAVMELALGTYGFINPRKSLYDAFVAWEGADGYRLGKTMLNYDQMKAFGVTVQPGAAVYGNEGYFFWKNQSLREDCITDILSVKAADLASFDEAACAWVVAEGEYQFLVGASSQDIKATLTANAKAQQTKANDVLKPQTQMNLLKR